jgi:hypothetical protein
MNRLLGTTDDRITGKPETIPKCLKSRIFGKFAGRTLVRTAAMNANVQFLTFGVVTPIPAHAGEPRSKYARLPADRVYPRICGGPPEALAVRRNRGRQI